jgi:hypothetical protein
VLEATHSRRHFAEIMLETLRVLSMESIALILALNICCIC